MQKRKYIKYICKCGEEFTRRSDYKYNTKNCNDCQRKIKNNKLTKHGHTHKKNNRCVKSKTYISWDGMKQRCYNVNHKAYFRYGGKGILVCSRWKNSFVNFLKDMGEKPEGLSLDRIDNEGNYCKENCRWATRKQQQNNTRKNRLISIDGTTKTAQEWCDFYNVDWNMVRGRIKRGIEPKKAFCKPKDEKFWKNRRTL